LVALVLYPSNSVALRVSGFEKALISAALSYVNTL
jgi:hypothetical protein